MFEHLGKSLGCCTLWGNEVLLGVFRGTLGFFTDTQFYLAHFLWDVFIGFL